MRRHISPAPAIGEISIVEKKRIAPGAGYVIQSGSPAWKLAADSPLDDDKAAQQQDGGDGESGN